MVLFFLVVFAIGFGISLLPFVYPGTVLSTFGVALNGWLGGLLGTTLGVGKGSLVLGPPGQAALTLQGVLAVYLPVLVLMIFILRGR